MKTIDVLAIGMVTIDFIYEVEHYPEEGSTSRIDKTSTWIGGTTGRAALACAYLDAKTVFAGMVGHGIYADLLKGLLAHEPLETQLIAAGDESGSQHSFVLLAGKSGERTILWTPQPRATPACHKLCGKLIPKARCVLLDATDLVLALAVAHACAEQNVPLVFDTGSYKPEADAILRLTDYIIAPEKYFTARAEARGQSYSDALAEAFREFGSKLLMATEGERGGVYWEAEAREARRYNAAPVHVVDSCGAGDVFHGGFAYGVARGWPLPKTIDFSAWLAAQKCAELGNAGLPSAVQIPAQFAG